jgi:hypothetical protein
MILMNYDRSVSRGDVLEVPVPCSVNETNEAPPRPRLVVEIITGPGFLESRLIAEAAPGTGRTLGFCAQRRFKERAWFQPGAWRSAAIPHRMMDTACGHLVIDRPVRRGDVGNHHSRCVQGGALRSSANEE